MTTIVLATRNRGKIVEFRAALENLGFTVRSLHDFPAFPDVVEDASTFRENALKKARATFTFTGLPSLADDSGLEVDALGGLPGVQSHRFAGPQGDDTANNAKLLTLLQGLPPEKRTARFRAVLALVWGEGKELTVDGTCEGVILEKERGSGGFGYDPLFYLPERDLTMAEMDLQDKNAVSHRGKAIQRLSGLLTDLIKRGELQHAHRCG
ncbi:MAG: XTP/dITP diphosphatase [bacterium]